jgi:hypothetical protein
MMMMISNDYTHLKSAQGIQQYALTPADMPLNCLKQLRHIVIDILDKSTVMHHHQLPQLTNWMLPQLKPLEEASQKL